MALRTWLHRRHQSERRIINNHHHNNMNHGQNSALAPPESHPQLSIRRCASTTSNAASRPTRMLLRCLTASSGHGFQSLQPRVQPYHKHGRVTCHSESSRLLEVSCQPHRSRPRHSPNRLRVGLFLQPRHIFHRVSWSRFPSASLQVSLPTQIGLPHSQGRRFRLRAGNLSHADRLH